MEIIYQTMVTLTRSAPWYSYVLLFADLCYVGEYACTTVRAFMGWTRPCRPSTFPWDKCIHSMQSGMQREGLKQGWCQPDIIPFSLATRSVFDFPWDLHAIPNGALRNKRTSTAQVRWNTILKAKVQSTKYAHRLVPRRTNVLVLEISDTTHYSTVSTILTWQQWRSLTATCSLQYSDTGPAQSPISRDCVVQLCNKDLIWS